MKVVKKNGVIGKTVLSAICLIADTFIYVYTNVWRKHSAQRCGSETFFSNNGDVWFCGLKDTVSVDVEILNDLCLVILDNIGYLVAEHFSSISSPYFLHMHQCRKRPLYHRLSFLFYSFSWKADDCSISLEINCQ